MAKLRVEQKGGMGNWWIWALIAAAVVLLVFAMFGWWGGERQAGLYDPTRQQAVTYEGEAWIPAGNAVTFPADQMVVVGESEQGHTLYANREEGYREGGGAGEITPGTEPQPYGRIYVKTNEGQYIPLFQQSGLE